MSSTAQDVETTPPRRRRDPLLPPQHGAWAFLGLPLALGVTAGSWTPVWAVLSVAWVVAYPLSWATSGLIGGPRRERFRKPFLVWAGLFVPLAAVTVWLRPWLWVAGAAYAVLFAVNLVYARARRERALANDLVLIAECSLMVPVVVGVASTGATWSPPADVLRTGQVLVLVLACALTLVGSTLHVKSLIRERNDRRYALASQAFAVLCVPVMAAAVAWWGPGRGYWLLVPFVVLAVRARLVPGHSWRPGRIGMIELAAFVLVVVAAALAG